MANHLKFRAVVVCAAMTFGAVAAGCGSSGSNAATKGDTPTTDASTVVTGHDGTTDAQGNYCDPEVWDNCGDTEPTTTTTTPVRKVGEPATSGRITLTVTGAES